MNALRGVGIGGCLMALSLAMAKGPQRDFTLGLYPFHWSGFRTPGLGVGMWVGPNALVEVSGGYFRWAKWSKHSVAPWSWMGYYASWVGVGVVGYHLRLVRIRRGTLWGRVSAAYSRGSYYSRVTIPTSPRLEWVGGRVDWQDIRGYVEMAYSIPVGSMWEVGVVGSKSALGYHKRYEYEFGVRKERFGFQLIQPTGWAWGLYVRYHLEKPIPGAEEDGWQEGGYRRGVVVAFHGRDSVYDAAEWMRVPRFHQWIHPEVDFVEAMFSPRWLGRPAGYEWSVTFRRGFYGVSYGRRFWRWLYWREWRRNQAAMGPLVRYRGQVRHDRLAGEYYRQWLNNRLEVVAQAGLERRTGDVARLFDYPGDSMEIYEKRLKVGYLNEVGITGGLQLRVYPLWFLYVYADGGVSHMLWGRMVGYHRTTWTLGVGAGVRIPLGEETP